jgi:hypothetical protein
VFLAGETHSPTCEAYDAIVSSVSVRWISRSKRLGIAGTTQVSRTSSCTHSERRCSWSEIKHDNPETPQEIRSKQTKQ